MSWNVFLLTCSVIVVIILGEHYHVPEFFVILMQLIAHGSFTIPQIGPFFC